jgi:acyl-CoA reductase-like NAD-dependent aldehyde dehydrogenase
MEAKLLIANRDVDSSNGKYFEVLNPLTGRMASRSAAASVSDAEKAVDAAVLAFGSWAQIAPTARRELLIQCASEIEQRSQQFIHAMMEETGATAAWGDFNVRLGAAMLREAAAMTTQISGEVIPSDSPGLFAFSVREAAGVVVGIAPWNAPVILGVRAMALPLSCGNCVVLKSSEFCPYTQYLLGTAFRAAGLPAGVVNVISTSREQTASVVESLIAHREVRRVNFTGSTRVGRVIAEISGRHLKPVLLELGGKAPLVVLDDGDLDEAVNAAAFGAFLHQGQICMSTERIIIERCVAEDFLERLRIKAKSLTTGDPRNQHTQIGSLISLESATRLDQLVKDAVSKGARIVCGGKLRDTIMQPTILDDVTPDMKIYHEESFGPVVYMVRVENDEEAVRVANDTEYGLTAAVFSMNIARALAVARRMRTGMCHINGATIHDEAQMPFGGTKASGYGRFGGRAGIAEFTELRWITIQTGPTHYPI